MCYFLCYFLFYKICFRYFHIFSLYRFLFYFNGTQNKILLFLSLFLLFCFIKPITIIYFISQCFILYYDPDSTFLIFLSLSLLLFFISDSYSSFSPFHWSLRRKPLGTRCAQHPDTLSPSLTHFSLSLLYLSLSLSLYFIHLSIPISFY